MNTLTSFNVKGGAKLKKRSLHKFFFGKKNIDEINKTQLKMLNGFMLIFNSFSGEAYDSDVVRASVDAIARNGAKLKAKHTRKIGSNVDNRESHLEKLLQYQPNRFMDSYSFFYKVITQLYMKNNSFIYVDRDQFGVVKGFYPVNSSTVELLEGDNEIYAKFRFLGGQTVTLPYEDLIHLRRFFYRNDLYGETSDKALNPTLQLIQTTDEGIANAVKSSAYLRGLLKFTGSLRPEDIKKQRDMFVEDYMDVNNNGGVAATDTKTEYQELKNDPKMIDEANEGNQRKGL
jgi:HK97 family phage portal protein